QFISGVAIGLGYNRLSALRGLCGHHVHYCISSFSILNSPFISLPLGWGITGFQPYGVCAVTMSIIAFLHSQFSILHSFQALPLGWDMTGFQPFSRTSCSVFQGQRPLSNSTGQRPVKRIATASPKP
ncbi:MAG: hypothetical protein LBT78_03240, partial [Tannerella sp.]|nr:hypothetical protein [Tannerella sp.]